MQWRSYKNLEEEENILEPRQTFHVEKINNHAFKIYKGKSGSSEKAKLAMNMSSVDNMNFKINFRNSKQASKPQIEQVMKDYKRMNASGKNSLSPNISTSDFADSNRKKIKSSHKYSFAAQGSFKGVGGSRQRSMTANKTGNRSHHFNLWFIDSAIVIYFPFRFNSYNSKFLYHRSLEWLLSMHSINNWFAPPKNKIQRLWVHGRLEFQKINN